MQERVLVTIGKAAGQDSDEYKNAQQELTNIRSEKQNKVNAKPERSQDAEAYFKKMVESFKSRYKEEGGETKAKEDDIEKWAREHPDDPDAQEYLRRMGK